MTNLPLPPTPTYQDNYSHQPIDSFFHMSDPIPWTQLIAGPVLVLTLVDIHPSFICARLKNRWNKFNCSSINSIVQLRTVEAQTLNSHVIKTILDSDWFRGRENYSNCVRVHVWNRTNRTKTVYLYKQSTIGRKRLRRLVVYCIDGWGL